MTTDALSPQDFDSILADLQQPEAGELQRAKCREFVKKITHNGSKSDKDKILAALGSWLKFLRGKLSDEAKAKFKEAVDRMLTMMEKDGKITADNFLAEYDRQLAKPETAQTLRRDWLSCWSDMFSACDADSDDRLIQEEAETLLLAFNVPQEFSEPLFDLLCDEFEEKLNRRVYLRSMNEYFFTDDKNGIFGQLFSDSVPAS